MRVLKTIGYIALWLWTLFIVGGLLTGLPMKDGKIDIPVTITIILIALGVPWGIYFLYKRWQKRRNDSTVQAQSSVSKVITTSKNQQEKALSTHATISSTQTNKRKETILGAIAAVVLVAGILAWTEEILPWWGVIIAVLAIWTSLGAVFGTEDQPSDKDKEWLNEQYRIAEEELRAEGLLDDDDYDEFEDDDWNDELQRASYERLNGELEFGHRYKMVYEDFHGNITERTIKLLYTDENKRGDTMLQAWCDKADDIRTFKLRNIQSLVDLDTGEVLR